MNVGIGLFTCREHPDVRRPIAERYREVIDLCRTADDVGVDSAWVSEHHFMEDGYLSGVIPAMAAMAGATRDIVVGPYIALLPFYDPVRLAEDVATMSLLSDGRVTLGLGLGHRDDEFEAFGVSKDERAARAEDAVRVLYNAWSEGPLGYDPEFHDISPDQTVSPKPDVVPDVVLGGSAKPAVRRAARLADGWAAGASLSVDDIRLRTDDIEAVREDEGIDGEFTTYVTRYGFVADSREEAWERMRDGYLFSRRVYADWMPSRFERSNEWEREMRDRAIFGPPGTVAEEIASLRSALDDDIHFIFRVVHPGVDTERTAECIRRVGDEVMDLL